VIVIAELLGVPTADRDKFKGWSRDLARTLDPIVTPEIIEAGNNALWRLSTIFGRWSPSDEKDHEKI